MAVAVMSVGIMRVRVSERRMGVLVSVRFPRRVVRSMGMLVMQVVAVGVVVRERLVRVRMLMAFSQM